MASTFFSNDEPNTASANAGAPRRPTLTSIACGPVVAETSVVEDLPSGLETRRVEVAPPSLFARSHPLWKAWAVGFWQWLWDLEDAPPAPAATTGLRKIKSEFNSAMWDLQSVRANHVRGLIEQARSLRELWHLRADVFRVISVHRGQIEAQLRLDALDSHFPVRSSSVRGEPSRNSKVTAW